MFSVVRSIQAELNAATHGCPVRFFLQHSLAGPEYILHGTLYEPWHVGLRARCKWQIYGHSIIPGGGSLLRQRAKALAEMMTKDIIRYRASRPMDALTKIHYILSQYDEVKQKRIMMAVAFMLGHHDDAYNEGED